MINSKDEIRWLREAIRQGMAQVEQLRDTLYELQWRTDAMENDISRDMLIYMQEVGETYHVTLSDIKGDRRPEHISAARFVLYYVLRERGGMSFPEIGKRMNRDHSSIQHGVKVVTRRLRNPGFAKGVAELLARIDVRIAASKAAAEVICDVTDSALPVSATNNYPAHNSPDRPYAQ